MSSLPSCSKSLVNASASSKSILFSTSVRAQGQRRWKSFSNNFQNVQLHFTPTYSSWLNQVGIWFARVEREVIARGVFTSVKDLARKLMRYIHAYSAAAKLFS